MSRLPDVYAYHIEVQTLHLTKPCVDSFELMYLAFKQHCPAMFPHYTCMLAYSDTYYRAKQDLETSLSMDGWEGVGVKALGSLSLSEVRKMLIDVAWREVMDSWWEEAESQSKLVEERMLMKKECKAWCVKVKCKRRGMILAKLRGGTARLEFEMHGQMAGWEKRIDCVQELSKWRSGGCGALGDAMC